MDRNQKIFLVGGITFAAIGAYLLWPKKASAAPMPPGPPVKPQPMGGGGAPVVNQSVSTVQAKLTSLGFDTKGVDGQMGPNTVAALKAYQQSQGLPVTGQIDGATSARLFGAPAQVSTPTIAATTDSTPAMPSSIAMYIPGYPDAIYCDASGTSSNGRNVLDYIQSIYDPTTLDAITASLNAAYPTCSQLAKASSDRAKLLRNAGNVIATAASTDGSSDADLLAAQGYPTTV